MIRFHVLHDEVIRCATFQAFFQVGKPFFALAFVGCIHDGNLFVHHEVRVIRNAIWHNVLTFEQIDGNIVYTNVFNLFGNV